MTIPVLFEDEDIVVVGKPAGTLSQGTRDPQRPHLISELSKQLGLKTLFLHHRLDKDTSGVILLGKTSRVNANLTDQFRDHTVQKTYLALVKPGPAFSGSEFTVKLHMAPVKGPRGVERMVVVKSGGWHSETHFKKLWEGEQSALIQCSPVTGRTHQLRVHLAHLKRPILGDRVYGGKSTLVPRLILHAWALEFSHPVTQVAQKVVCPLPLDFQGVLKGQGFADFAALGAN